MTTATAEQVETENEGITVEDGPVEIPRDQMPIEYRLVYAEETLDMLTPQLNLLRQRVLDLGVDKMRLQASVRAAADEIDALRAELAKKATKKRVTHPK